KIRTNGRKVTLTGLNGKAAVNMYDAVGKLIYQYDNVTNDNSFDVNIAGMYIMDINTETQQVRVKVIVNKN
ncbi:MAG TPA: T9SS type A sorting domain-containing protein, partial [Paludibacter sp.]|nr:T9SS type A sorting domain-containing protein [Paludibacter sp.]